MLGLGIFGGLFILAAIAALIVWGLIYFTGVAATLAVCFIFVCLLMMLVILIQKPRGGGLSGAFGGGGGSSQAAFGSKTGDVLTYVTIGLFIAFLGLAMGLTWTVNYKPAPPTTLSTPGIPATPGTPADETTPPTTPATPASTPTTPRVVPGAGAVPGGGHPTTAPAEPHP